MAVEEVNEPNAVRIRVVSDDGKVFETDKFILIQKDDLEDGDFRFTSDLHLTLTLHELEKLVDFVHDVSEALSYRLVQAIHETQINLGDENVR